MTPTKTTNAPINAGMKIPVPSVSKWCTSLSFHAQVISVLNSFLNLQVKLANGYAKVTMTGQGCLIDLTRIQAGSSNSRGLPMTFLGEYTSADNPFFAGETVDITVGINAGHYTSLVDNNTDPPYNSTNWKKHPAAPQTGNWQ